MKHGSVYIFKIVSGEEVIGELVTDHSNEYSVKSAAVIIMQQTQQGVGVALMPFMPYSEGAIRLNKDMVSTTADPSQNMVNEYNRLFGAGIQIAPASALSGLLSA